MSLKRLHSPSSSISRPSDPVIYRSIPIHDRSSKFEAFFSPDVPVQELKELEYLDGATHRITAWRKPSSQRSLSSQPVYESGYDDDGEKYGGKTVAKVLQEMNITGSIVVGRWYGGILLGPARFDHIKNCAREAIGVSQQEERVQKKQKIAGTQDELSGPQIAEEDKADDGQLIQVLRERDESIRILRGLLAEKKGKVGAPGEGRKMNYEKMPVMALRRLEKVRDETIGWILKELQKFESEEDTVPMHGEEPGTRIKQPAEISDVEKMGTPKPKSQTIANPGLTSESEKAANEDHG